MITDHVFRRVAVGARRVGQHGGPTILEGTCWYLTSCGRPASEHIAPSEFRARRKARPA